MVGLAFSGILPDRQSGLSAGCEPAADLQVAARVVEIDQQGAKARVVIEMVVSSHLELTSFRVHQSRLSFNSSGRARLGMARRGTVAPIPMVLLEADPGRLSGMRRSARQMSVPASRRLLRRGDLVANEDATLIREGVQQVLRYAVILTHGVDHHLLLSVDAEDLEGGIHAAQAYVRVGLDPSTQPERPEGLVQFRARQVR